MSTKGYSQRISNIFKMIFILASNKGRFFSKQQLATILNTKLRNIVEYRRDINNIEVDGTCPFAIIIKGGKSGGYQIEASEHINLISTKLMSSGYRNALQDAIQKAMVDKNFPYKSEILEINNHYFSGVKWEYDYEHYLGNVKPNIAFENIVKQIKNMIINERQIKLTFIFAEEKSFVATVDPHLVLHDEDESFLVCYSFVKNDIFKNKARLYNIRNISLVEEIGPKENFADDKLLSFVRNNSVIKKIKPIKKTYLFEKDDCKKVIGIQWDGSHISYKIISKEIGQEKLRFNITFSDNLHISFFEKAMDINKD